MMKKTTKLLSVILALCLVVSLLPGMALAASSTVDTAAALKEAVAAANDGDTITIAANLTLTDTLEINKPITLNGGSKTITFSGNAAISVTAGTTAKPVTLTNLVVTGAKTGISIAGGSYVKMTGSIDLAHCTEKGIYVANSATLDLTNATLSFAGEGQNTVPVLAREGSDAVINQSTKQPLYNVDDNFFLAGDAKLTHTTPASGSTAAKTTTVGYHSLDAALGAAVDGDTLTLNRAVSIASLTISKSLTFDLGGKELSFTGAAGMSITKASSDVTVTLKNGTVKAATTAVSLENATLNLASNAILKGGDNAGVVLVVGENSTANISGDISTDVGSGVAISDVTGKTSTITIKSGADILAKTASTGTVGVQILGNCTLSIEAGTVTGSTALSLANGNTTVTTGSFTGDTALSVSGNDANVTVSGGTFTGGSTSGTGANITKGTVKLKGGVYSGKTAIIAATGTTTISSGCCFAGTVTLADKLATLGCYFTVAPASSILADKVIVGASDKAGYSFMTKSASAGYAEVDTLVVTKPGSSTSYPQKAAYNTGITDSSKLFFTAAAGDIAAKVTDTQAALKKALTDAKISVSDSDTYKVVIHPTLTITTGSYSSTNHTLSFKAATTYDKIATKASTANSSIALTGTSKNAVALASAQTLSLPSSSAIEYSLLIPKAIATETATNSGKYKDLQVKQLASDGSTYIYAAKITGSGNDLTATFTSTHGAAGTFTLQPSREISVTFDRTAAGSTGTHSKTYTLDSIGTALPTFTNCIGWTFTSSDKTAISGTYTKVTDELWSALMNTESGSTIKAAAVTAGSVDIKASTYGKVTADKTTGLKKDDVVTLTVTPNSGYVLKTLVVSSANGYVINYTTVITNSKYTFKMPAENVTVTATFATNFPFKDVILSDWYYDEVKYAYDKGLVSGLDATTFGPENTTTRGMVVTLLHRMSGSPSIATDNTFTDVSNSMYYAKPIVWANYNEIVTGYGKNKFGPEDNITREQMATILYKYVQYRGKSVTGAADLSSFTDSSKISSYAKTAMSWAVAKGLINGMGNGTIAPQGAATRAQVAAILMRLDQNIL